MLQTNIEANRQEQSGNCSKEPIYNNPADETKKLTATNTNAGNVIVKTYKYADDTDYTHETWAETTIPFSDLKDGKFSITFQQELLQTVT